MSDRPHPIGDPPADEPAPAPDPDEGWEEDDDDEEPLTRIGGQAGLSTWSFSAQLATRACRCLARARMRSVVSEQLAELQRDLAAFAG
jgi:hypothetical protein